MSNFIKDILRISTLQIRSALPGSYQQAISEKISQRISHSKIYRQAKKIALYQTFNNEIDLKDIWYTAPYQGKYCYFPVISETKRLLFLPATPKTVFTQNKYGIYEPCVDLKEAISPDKLDIIFLPLVGFDIFGTRLGMGKGYYDSSLAIAGSAIKIGVAYEFQKQDYIPPDTWDVRLNYVITESQIYTFD